MSGERGKNQSAMTLASSVAVGGLVGGAALRASAAAFVAPGSLDGATGCSTVPRNLRAPTAVAETAVETAAAAVQSSAVGRCAQASLFGRPSVGISLGLAVAVAASRHTQRRRALGRLVGCRRAAVAEAAPLRPGEAASRMPSRGTFPPRPTPLLDSLGDEGPQGLRSMTVDQLVDLSEEVRWQVLDAVSVTGGHLGAGLGVCDLTVALHHVFDTPSDEIVWDVAHQCQPHKVLTGRRSKIYTLRAGGGLSGFAKRKESKYDPFGAGHSGTSISAAVGFKVAKDRMGKKGHSIAVIGDGAITGGMAWEAMNHAGGMQTKVLVILNDNGQVSLPTFYNKVKDPVGALSQTLGNTGERRGLNIQNDIARIETSNVFQSARNLAKSASKLLFSEQLQSAAAKLDEYSRDFVKTVPFRGSGAGSKGELFEQLGFYYVGPIDGHDMQTLVEVLKNIKAQHEDGTLNKPVFLHIKTQKGKGYEPAQRATDKLHAVKPKFNIPKVAAPGSKLKVARAPLTKVFADALVREAEVDDKIVAMTAAMPGGTGIGIFEKRFGPERTFDVGIAEQHCTTFAAALAAGGLKPYLAIYSTFLQRGYDQVVHDIALQKLPVRMILDRAGLVGADGATHAGSFDLSYLACLPGMFICASADEQELVNMVHTVGQIDDHPTALRYPRGDSYGDLEMPPVPRFLEPGKGRIAREGRDNSLAILSVGGRLRECLKAADQLEEWGISVTVADARWVKPLDKRLIKWLAADHKCLVTVEENSIGGFAAQVQDVLFEGGHLDGVGQPPLVFRSMFLPDRWIDHDDPYLQYEDAELNASQIATKALTMLNCVGVKVNSPEIAGQ